MNHLRVPIIYDRSSPPYIKAEVRWDLADSSIPVRLVVDTGAFDITLSMRDVRGLEASRDSLEPSATPVSGIGGDADTFDMRGVSIILFGSDSRETIIGLDGVRVLDDSRPADGSGHRMRIPSLLGRKFMEDHGFTLHWNFARRIAYIDIAESSAQTGWRPSRSTS